MRREHALIILALIGGFVLAVLAFRRVHRHPAPNANVPPSAWPRYLQFGEYYDPYAIWPYGSNSNYQAVFTNSGVPTTSVPSPGSLTMGNFPSSPLYGGGTVAGSFGGGNGQGGSGGSGGGGGRGH